MKNIKTKCVNGELQAGDLVISTPDDDYSCLIGRVLRINLVGTPEHDEETANETDDIHVNFLEFDYSKKRIAEIEAEFSEIYGLKKHIDDCGLDDVIMNPACLIRITDVDDSMVQYLLQSGYIAACYCYGRLSDVTYQTEQNNKNLEIALVENEMEFLHRAESGFKITRIINGQTVEIELSGQELYNAFCYKENKFYFQDVGGVLEEMEENSDLESRTAEEIQKNTALMTQIVSAYEKNRDDYGMEWHEAATDAINDTLAEFEQNNENDDSSESEQNK